MTYEQMVASRRVIAALRATTEPGRPFNDWQEADLEAHAVYLTLFTDDEKRRVVSWARLPRPGCQPDEPIETWDQAITFYGTSLIREALGDSM